MQSHSEVLGVGALTYEFGWGRDTFICSVAPVMYQALVVEQQTNQSPLLHETDILLKEG